MARQSLKFLLDTNVLIPLEPTSPDDQELGTRGAAQLLNGILEGRHQAYLHPASNLDINRDKNVDRRELRRLLAKKYLYLPEPPPVHASLASKIGSPGEGSNDWVDDQLLAAVDSSAVHFLVTEDQNLIKKARRAGLEDVVLTVADAVSLLFGLLPLEPAPPPAVLKTLPHTLNLNDRIFDSFREDYKGFDSWFRRCCEQHRDTWIIRGDESQLAAIAIVKHEQQAFGMSGKILKICSFKVSSDFGGFRYSELLLRAVFEYALENRYEWVYVTVFDQHANLVARFQDFGFCRIPQRTELGELVLIKRLVAPVGYADWMNPLQYHVTFGPRSVIACAVPWFLVPIRPVYVNRLFPEATVQKELFQGQDACGNAIRKAYLCNSPIRKIVPGSILIFYRSQENQGAIAMGIVERVLVSTNAAEIARMVSSRTVYSFEEIERLCDEQETLVILFRQPVGIRLSISLDELERHSVLQSPPQSIVEVRERGRKWLQTRLGL